MFLIKILRKFVKALGSNSSPNQLALGFSLGMILGLTPLFNIHNLLIIFIIAIIQVNISGVLLGFILFSSLAPLLDTLFIPFGNVILQAGSMEAFWTLLYNNTFFIATRFNNTLVMGSFVAGLILFVPVFFAFKWFSVYYKNKLHPKVEKWKITKIVKGTKLFRLLNTGYKLRQ